MKYLSLINIWRRLKGTSPTFFKKVRKIMIALGGVGAALIALKMKYPVNMSFLSDTIGGYLLTAGSIGTFLSSLTVESPQENKIK